MPGLDLSGSLEDRCTNAISRVFSSQFDADEAFNVAMGDFYGGMIRPEIVALFKDQGIDYDPFVSMDPKENALVRRIIARLERDYNYRIFIRTNTGSETGRNEGMAGETWLVFMPSAVLEKTAVRLTLADTGRKEDPWRAEKYDRA